MSGPLPVPDHERLRRNPEDVFVSPHGGVPPPAIPHYDDWSLDGRAWWDALLVSPQAQMYTAVEWQVAARVPDLITNGKPRALAEVRELEDRLMITTVSRRRARVDLPGEEGSSQRPTIDYRKMFEGEVVKS